MVISEQPGVRLVKKIYTKDLLKSGSENQRYRICGWVDRVRDLGKIKFILVRDREGIIQAIARVEETPSKVFEVIRNLDREDVICVEGVFKKNPQAPGGGEIVVENIDVLSKVVEVAPIEVHNSTESDLATRLRWRWLDVRNPRIMGIFVLEAEVAHAFREYFRSNGFIEIFTPKIVGGATEGGAEVFPIVYFDRQAFLAQSPQFYKQMGVIAGFERVFEIGPVYRAEKHHTVRHLTEYHSIDYEVGFIDGLEDVISVAEGAFKYVVESVLRKETTKMIIESYGGSDILIPKEMPKITMREAYRILEGMGKKIPFGEDLDSEAERLLWMYARKEFSSDFIFVTEYPWKVRPFYAMRKPGEPEWTLSFDLIFRGLEVATGGQREHRYHVLVEQAREKGLNPDNFWFYLEFFKYGAPPHGGAGIGLERVVMQILKLSNIREARLLPRDPERLFP
ncbi:MAG: aspartate--tRNA(Asn) ligase [Desulfurococcaceae archaeon]|jgi:nondiscriminating aspartyl-tRNA synthetase|nr:MAG: aspartate--tRNA(Asn) ligase [Desulfurococcaceae archaeon]